MLRSVRKAARIATFLALMVSAAAFAKGGARNGNRERGDSPQARSAPVQPAQPSLPGPSGTQQPPQAQTPQRTIQTVVLDPAHGGTDEGAHGANGILEKDVTLRLAQVVAARLRSEGLHVLMTRTGDQTVSFEQRAAIANAQTGAIFLSLHVGSSGTVGSAYAYYYDFGQIGPSGSPGAGHGLVSWDLAQRPWQSYSRRLAQLVQVELAARFRGSPELPVGAAVYQLREINEPAVAIEIENVNAPSAKLLEALAKPLAQSISRAIQSFRAVYGADLR
jgi:N-acetylmuramoyl-L-alanine amidase